MEDNHIFMLCKQINSQAFSGLDSKYTIRKLNRDELDIWKTIHFDNESDKKAYKSFMDEYYQKHYADREKEFFKRCFVLCENDTIIGTCFTWKNKAGGWTLQWFKVKHERSEEHTSELQSRFDLVCRLLLEKTTPPAHGWWEKQQP